MCRAQRYAPTLAPRKGNRGPPNRSRHTSGPFARAGDGKCTNFGQSVGAPPSRIVMIPRKHTGRETGFEGAPRA